MGERWRQLWRLFVPRLRRPWHPRLAAPLIVFAVLFPALCIGLEVGQVLLFARPWALGLAVLAVWVWWLHVAGYSGLPRVRGQVALATRLLLLGLLVIVLAEPRAVRTSDILAAMFLVDVSDSVRPDSVDAALRYVIEAAQTKRPRDEAGLIAFGKTPAVELPPRATFPFEALNSQLDRGSTNLEQSLSLAAAMLPDDRQGRLVVLSDGVQTEGNLGRVLDDLKHRGIAVDVVPIDFSYEHEVWIERLDLPQEVKLGETYEAAIVLSALEAGTGKLTLRENGQIVFQQTVSFQSGKNRLSVPISLRSAGYYEYSASIDVDSSLDTLAQNNTALGYIFVEGEGQILLVTDPTGSPNDWKPFEQLLRQGERRVRTVSAFEFPEDVSALLPYDCIIFCNVPYDAFDLGQLSGLKEAVYNVGIGFLMVGGNNSFGMGGWNRTVVEEILPVTMDVSNKKVLPKGALAIILHTCEFASGNTRAKQMTKSAITALNARDEVGVLAFGGTIGKWQEFWVFPFTPAAEYERLVPLIDGAEIGDMPTFQGTMQMGLDGLMATDAATRHMIIISDGDPQPPPPQLLQKFSDNGISVSTIAVFPHGGFETQAMASIANATGGRYYFVNDNPDVLPQLFIKEAKTLKRSLITTRTFAPEIAFPSPILKGLDAIPELDGYVVTNPKPAPAMTVLQAPPTAEDPAQTDPILVVWQHGLGKTAAWTSDFSSKWANNWQGWGRYEAFLKQLMTDLARVRKPGALRLAAYPDGGQALLITEDFHSEESFLDLTARVAGPGNKSVSIRLKQVGPRRYQATVPLWGHGRYHVVAAGKGSDRDEQALGGFIIPYSPEYLRFRSNRQTLTEVAERTGGRVLEGQAAKDRIFESDRQVRRSSQPVFDWFLVAVACLVPVDIAVRRLQIEPQAIWRSLWRRRRSESTATMGTLLARKAQVSSTLKGDRHGLGTAEGRDGSAPSARPAERPLLPRGERGEDTVTPSPAGMPISVLGGPVPGSGSAVPSRTTDRPTAAASGSDAAPPPAAPAVLPPASTTERLLQLKKKRQGDNPDKP